ncbi:DUF7310 family coiled-coil domain-containing protein [Haloarcula salina]|uniref:DUF7310 domain-containing protein n=1 Tax=Haloarcula salina TaxID=1429914 RepID=A0AA41G7B5_9EURY|nr:hypothetical protein [Haloarcula salina]MBV0901477.1 hypothetical protein [Haloarcula salina]
MTDVETLAERLQAVERAVTDGETEFPEVTDRGEFEDRIDGLEGRVDDLETRTAELEAATQALRGYVGNVRAVNEDVESRANAALAAVDRLEARLDEPAPAERPVVSGDAAERSNETTYDGTRADSHSGPPVPGGEGHTDFGAITNGGDGETTEEPSPGVLERIRERL